MSEIETLVDMGFPKERAEYAMKVTNFNGVEPAMEWLLAHVGEEIPASVGSDVPQNTLGTATAVADATPTPAPVDGEVEASSSSATGESAKSLKCDDCSRLFKDQSEVEFHAAKTGHSNFSESTEEKKPLTEEEKQKQLALIEEKLKQKRIEREERERVESLEREKNRIKSGKDMTEARKRMEEMEMKKILEQRKREKEEEKVARDRVRAQIQADKARRAMDQGTTSPPSAVSSTTTTAAPIAAAAAAAAASPKAPPKDYTNTRIQIRLQDGSTLTETFSVKEQLSAVRVFIQMKQGADLPFGLMTTFPRKVFSDDDFEKPLEVLGLVPSAVLIVTKSLA